MITTVFISEKLFKYLINSSKTNILIFTHHPLYQNQYDYSWTSFYPQYIDMLKQQKISIYSCHIPLDLHPRISTDYYFSKQLIADYMGRITSFDRYYSEELSIGHYGRCKDNIDDILKTIKPDYGRFMLSCQQPSIIACSPGGGGMLEYIKKAKVAGVDTYITGCCVNKGNYAVGRVIDFFTEVKKLEMNIIELSHYSTESFVMKEMPHDYFSPLSVKCSFFDEEAVYIGGAGCDNNFQ